MYEDRTRIEFGAGGSSTVPLLFSPQVPRCMAAGPGGRPLRVLFDTGTDPSAIDLGLARRLGLPLGGFSLGSGAASDSVPFAESVLPWLRIGDLVLRDLYVLALDLRASPLDVDLVLGYNVLPYLRLHIDYRDARLRLCHPDLGPPQPSPQGALLPLSFYEHFPALSDLWVDEHLHLPLVTIDTGSNGGLTLGADLAARLGLLSDEPDASTGHGIGFGGASNIVQGLATSLRLGPFLLENIELDAPTAVAGDLPRLGRANLGNRLLSRFASLTLDYHRGLCVLERT
jgi:hypothetical protein